MSILLVTEEAIPPIYRFSLTEKLAIEIANRNYPVYLVCLKGHNNFNHPKVKYCPIEVEDWNLFDLKKRFEANIKLIIKIIKLCQEEKDIKLIYGWWPVLPFTKIFGKRIVADMPEFIEEMYRSFKKSFYIPVSLFLKTFQKITAVLSECIITESEISRIIWQNRKIRYEKTIAIPYGVDVDFFLNAKPDLNFRKKYGIDDGELVIMYHGDIGFDDGVDILIEATRGIESKVVIIGDGDKKYMQYLKNLAHQNVIFTGWLPYSSIPGILLNADIYVAPFRSTLYTNTTCPLKQMEAMAARRAVIVSKLQTFAQYVNDRFDCRLTIPGDIDDLRAKIVELIKSPEERTRLGINAGITAKKKFDWRLRVTEEAKLLIDKAL